MPQRGMSLQNPHLQEALALCWVLGTPGHSGVGKVSLFHTSPSILYSHLRGWRLWLLGLESLPPQFLQSRTLWTWPGGSLGLSCSGNGPNLEGMTVRFGTRSLGLSALHSHLCSHSTTPSSIHHPLTHPSIHLSDHTLTHLILHPLSLTYSRPACQGLPGAPIVGQCSKPRDPCQPLVQVNAGLINGPPGFPVCVGGGG